MKDGSERCEFIVRFGRRGYVLRYVVNDEAGIIEILRVWHGLEDREDA